MIIYLPGLNSFASKDGKITKDRITKRDKFTENTRLKKKKFGTDDLLDPDKAGPPDPGGGGDGWPIPVADGTEFLIIGGLIYFLYKRKRKRSK